MRILVVGANGNIGSFITPKLIKNYNVYSLSGSTSIITKNSASINLLNKIEVNNFVKNNPYFDSLIFLVGLAHKKGKSKDYNEFKKVNFITLKNLISSLSLNEKLPKKIIFSSTISVYGESLKDPIYQEDHCLSPKSPYAKTKCKAEKYLLKNYPKISWILRFAPVYSKKFMLNIERRTKILNSFYRVGDGRSTFSLCNVKNILSTIVGIIKDEIPNGVYNISDNREYSYNQLAKLQGANWFIPIPLFTVRYLYLLFNILHLHDLNENIIKLISDNIYPSTKIRNFINLNYEIEDSL